MSPPIYTPDGSEVSEIVLPDGSTASEVIGPDGNVVFEAVPDIPDSGLLHDYDWAAGSTTTSFVEDQIGTADLDTGSFSSFGTFGGKQAGVFDGSSDLLRATFTDSQPLDIYLAARVESTTISSSSDILVGGVDSFFHAPYIEYNSNTWRIYAGISVSTSTAPDTTDHIFASLFDGASSAVRIDGAQIGSGDAGSSDPGGVTVGADKNNSRHSNITVARLLVYDPNASGYSVTDVDSALNNIYGVY